MFRKSRVFLQTEKKISLHKRCGKLKLEDNEYYSQAFKNLRTLALSAKNNALDAFFPLSRSANLCGKPSDALFVFQKEKILYHSLKRPVIPFFERTGVWVCVPLKDPSSTRRKKKFVCLFSPLPLPLHLLLPSIFSLDLVWRARPPPLPSTYVLLLFLRVHSSFFFSYAHTS